MDTLRIENLRELTAHRNGPCVTVYLPTHVSGPDAEQDVVRLKNLLQQAEAQLSDGWLRAPEARDLLEPARKLPVDAAFWAARSQGLAIFLARGFVRCWRLPLALDELVMVNHRFHVKSLLPLLAESGRFLVLVLSQNKVRLLEGNEHRLEEIAVKGLPANMEQALNYTEGYRGSQVHSAARGGQGGQSGKQAAVFHGHGGVPETHKDDLTNFFRQVAAALKPALRDERAPLLLAGVDYLLPIYREVNSYPHVASVELPGNFDYQTDVEIHKQAWPKVAPLFTAGRAEAEARYRKLAGTGKTSDDIRQVVPAAHQGRVELVFVDRRAHEWGVYQPQQESVDVHAQCTSGDDDLFDVAAVETLLNRGAVYAVEGDQVPSQTGVAAVLRY